MGGNNLITWVNKNYLQNSNVKEFHLYDNDKDDYRKSIQDINAANDGRRFGMNTKMLEMENYIHPKLIEKEFGITFDNIDDLYYNSLISTSSESLQTNSASGGCVPSLITLAAPIAIARRMRLSRGSFFSNP